MQALGNMSDLAETYLQFCHPKGSGYHAVLPHRDSIIQNEIQLARRQVQYIADIRQGVANMPSCLVPELHLWQTLWCASNIQIQTLNVSALTGSKSS